MRRLAALIAVAGATSLGVLAVGGPATHATFPDRNGRIAFPEKRSGAEIYTIKPDGTGFHRLTHRNFDATFPIGRRTAAGSPSRVSSTQGVQS